MDFPRTPRGRSSLLTWLGGGALLALFGVGGFLARSGDDSGHDVAPRAQAEDEPNELRRPVAQALAETMGRLRSIAEWERAGVEDPEFELRSEHAEFVTWLSGVAARRWHHLISDGERDAFFGEGVDREEGPRSPTTGSSRLEILVERASSGTLSTAAPESGAFSPRAWYRQFVLDCPEARCRVDLLDIGREDSTPEVLRPVLEAAVRDGAIRLRRESAHASRVDAWTDLAPGVAAWFGVESDVERLVELRAELDAEMRAVLEEALSMGVPSAGGVTGSTQTRASIASARELVRDRRGQQARAVERITAALRRKYVDLGGPLEAGGEGLDDALVGAWASLAEDALLLYKLTETPVEMPAPLTLPEGLRAYLRIIPNSRRNVQNTVGVTATELVNLVVRDSELIAVRRGAAELLFGVVDLAEQADLRRRGALRGSYAPRATGSYKDPEVERRIDLGLATSRIVWTLRDGIEEVPGPMTVRRLRVGWLDGADGLEELRWDLDREATDGVLREHGLPAYVDLVGGRVRIEHGSLALEVELAVPALREAGVSTESTLDMGEFVDRARLRELLRGESRAALASVVADLDGRAHEEGLELAVLPRLGNDALRLHRLSIASYEPLTLTGLATSAGRTEAPVSFELALENGAFVPTRIDVGDPTATALAVDRLAGLAGWDAPESLAELGASLAQRRVALDRAVAEAAAETEEALVVRADRLGLGDLAAFLDGRVEPHLRRCWIEGLLAGRPAEEVLVEALTLTFEERELGRGLENTLTEVARALDASDARRALVEAWTQMADEAARSLSERVGSTWTELTPVIEDEALQQRVVAALADVVPALRTELVRTLGQLDPRGTSESAGIVLSDATLRVFQEALTSALAPATGPNPDATAELQRAAATRFAELAPFLDRLGKLLEGDGSTAEGLARDAEDWFEGAAGTWSAELPSPEALWAEIDLSALGLPGRLADHAEVSGLQGLADRVLGRPQATLSGDVAPHFLIRPQELRSVRTTLAGMHTSRRRAIDALASEVGLDARVLLDLLASDLGQAAAVAGLPLDELTSLLREAGFALASDVPDPEVARTLQESLVAFRERAARISALANQVVLPVLDGLEVGALDDLASAHDRARKDVTDAVLEADERWAELRVDLERGLEQRVGRAAADAVEELLELSAFGALGNDELERVQSAVAAISRADRVGVELQAELRSWAREVESELARLGDELAADAAGAEVLAGRVRGHLDDLSAERDALRAWANGLARSLPAPDALNLRVSPQINSLLKWPEDVRARLRPAAIPLAGVGRLDPLADLSRGLDEARAVRRALEAVQERLEDVSRDVVDDVVDTLTAGSDHVVNARDRLTRVRGELSSNLEQALVGAENSVRRLERLQDLRRGVEREGLATARSALERLDALVRSGSERATVEHEELLVTLDQLLLNGGELLRGPPEAAASRLNRWAEQAQEALADEALGADVARARVVVDKQLATLNDHAGAVESAVQLASGRLGELDALGQQVLSSATVDALMRDLARVNVDVERVLTEADAEMDESARGALADFRDWAARAGADLASELGVPDAEARLRDARACARELVERVADLDRIESLARSSEDRLRGALKTLNELDLPVDRERLEAWESGAEEWASGVASDLDIREPLEDLRRQLADWEELVDQGEDVLRRQLRRESAELAARLSVPVANFRLVEGEVRAVVDGVEASIGEFEELARLRGEELEDHVARRVEAELASVLEAVGNARDEIEERAKQLLESEVDTLAGGLRDLVPETLDLFGYRCAVTYSAERTGFAVTLSYPASERIRENHPDAFSVAGAIEFELRDDQVRPRFSRDAELPLPQLRRALERTLADAVPGLALAAPPTLRDGRLCIDARYRPEGFPFDVVAQLVLDFEELASRRVRLNLDASVRAAVRAGLNELLAELEGSGQLPGLGPVQVERAVVLDVPRGLGIELDVRLLAYDPFTVPVVVRVLPGVGLDVDIDERAFGSALSQAMGAWLGDSLPLGLRLDDPAFDLEGGLHIFVRYFVDIPVFGAGLGGRLTLSADGIELDSSLTVKIPVWIDAPPVSFGEAAVTLDLRRQAVAVSGKVALSPGAATQYLLCARFLGEMALDPLELRARGDLFLAGGLLSLAESEIVLRPDLGSFECSMSAGGFASDLLRLEGLLRIEVLDNRMIVVDGKRANIYARSSMDLFGIRLSEFEAGFNFDLAMWARVESNLPLAAMSASLEIAEGLTDPRLRFQSRIGDDGKLSNIRVFVTADSRFVAADARAHALGIEVGAYLEFAGLADLVPWRILEELLNAIDLGLNPPRKLSFSLSNAKEGEDPKDENGKPNAPGDLEERKDPIPDAPKRVGKWNPVWTFEVEEKVVQRKKDGFLGFIGNEEWTETIRIVHCRNVKPLRGLFGLEGTPNKDRQAFSMQANGYLAVVDVRGDLTVYRSVSGRWARAWSGSTDLHNGLSAEPLFVEGGLAFFRLTADGEEFVISLEEGGTQLHSGELGKLPGSVYDCSDVLIDGRKVREAVADGRAVGDESFRQRLWITARLRLNRIPISRMEPLGQDGVYYLQSERANLVCVRTKAESESEPNADGTEAPKGGGTVLLRDWTGGMGEAFPVDGAYRDRLAAFAKGFESLPASETSMGLPAWGHLVAASTDGELNHALVLRSTSAEAGEAFLLARGEPTSAGSYSILSGESSIGDLSNLLELATSPSDELSEAREDLFAVLGTSARAPLELAVARPKGLGARMAVHVLDNRQGGALRPWYGVVAPRRQIGAEPWLQSVDALRTYFQSHPYYLPPDADLELLNDRDQMLRTLARGDWRERGWRVNPVGRLVR